MIQHGNIVNALLLKIFHKLSSIIAELKISTHMIPALMTHWHIMTNFQAYLIVY